MTRRELQQLLRCLDQPMIHTLFTSSTIPGVAPHRLSACLGVPSCVFVLLLQSVYIAKQRDTLSSIAFELTKLMKQLEDIRMNLEHYYGQEVASDRAAQRNRDVGNIFIHAIGIYVESISKASERILTQQSSLRVKEIMTLLDHKRTTTIETSLLWWPLAVVLCAIDERTTLNEFIRRSDDFHFDGGCKRRWAVLMETVIHRHKYARFAGSRQNGSQGLNNLDLLMMEDGIQTTFERSRRFCTVTLTSPGPDRFWLWQ